MKRLSAKKVAEACLIYTDKSRPWLGSVLETGRLCVVRPGSKRAVHVATMCPQAWKNSRKRYISMFAEMILADRQGAPDAK